MNNINKISGSVIAFFLYPLKSLIVNVGLIALTLILAPLSLIVLPILGAIILANILQNKGFSAIAAWSAALAAALLIAVVTPIAALIATVNRILFIIPEMIAAAVFGLYDGYENGLFFNVLRRALLDIRVFSFVLPSIIVLINITISDDEQSLAELSEENINEIHDSAFVPLSVEESYLSMWSPGISTTLEEYTDLYQRLTALDVAIKNKDTENSFYLEEITDEVRQIRISQPGLLTEEYQNENGVWRIISGRTKIIDQSSYESWLITNRCNSDTGERQEADQFIFYSVKRPTRFRFCSYTNMNDAQELKEASVSVRRNLEWCNPENIQLTKAVSFMRRHGIFADTEHRAQREPGMESGHDTQPGF